MSLRDGAGQGWNYTQRQPVYTLPLTTKGATDTNKQVLGQRASLYTLQTSFHLSGDRTERGYKKATR